MDILDRLDDLRTRIDVLQHPFYQRWNAGELEPSELSFYAGQYRHAVVALAQASRLAAEQAGPEHRKGLLRHAEEEAQHVELWDDFVRAVNADAADGAAEELSRDDTSVRREGASRREGTSVRQEGTSRREGTSVRQEGAAVQASEPLAQTRGCAAAWTAGEDLLEHLAVLYTLEASQPAISKTKLGGLTMHYGVPHDSPGNAYFKLHATLDVEHAQHARALIAELAPTEADEQRMLARAQAALHGNWTLLDGVQERHALVA